MSANTSDSTPKLVADIAQLLKGVTPAQWSRIKHGVDMEFDSMHNQLKLEDTESLARRISLEWW